MFPLVESHKVSTTGLSRRMEGSRMENFKRLMRTKKRTAGKLRAELVTGTDN